MMSVIKGKSAGRLHAKPFLKGVNYGSILFSRQSGGKT
jgi:hypothetical protein